MKYHVSHISTPKGQFLRFNLRIAVGDGYDFDYVGCLAGIKNGREWVAPPRGERGYKVAEWSDKVKQDLLDLLTGRRNKGKNWLLGFDKPDLWSVESKEEISWEEGK